MSTTYSLYETRLSPFKNLLHHKGSKEEMQLIRIANPAVKIVSGLYLALMWRFTGFRQPLGLQAYVK